MNVNKQRRRGEINRNEKKTVSLYLLSIGEIHVIIPELGKQTLRALGKASKLEIFHLTAGELHSVDLQ